MTRHQHNIPIILSLLLITLGYQPPALADGEASTQFKRIPLQYIAALGDPAATSGSGAQDWGLWRIDPGPRGVRLSGYNKLKAAGGIAPARWTFDDNDWWLEEHGLIMEPPDFPLPPAQYVVTGGRKVTTILTVNPADKEGAQRWALAKGAKLTDVTHIPCRAARYTPSTNDRSCSPAKAPGSIFPLSPGTAMPAVEGCHKQDFAVLFVIGVVVE